MKNLSVIKNGSLYFIGNLFSKAIAFVTIPIFTKLLTTEEYGIVNTYLSWVYLLTVIVGLSLGSTIRNAFVDKNNELNKYISSIFILAGLNFLVICIIYSFISTKINISSALVWLCLIESFFNFVVTTMITKYMMQEEALKRTVLFILPNLIGVILSIILIQYLTVDKYYGRVFATCISTSSFGIIIFVYYLSKYKNFFNREYWSYALPISIPLIFHGLAYNVLGTSDRSIIVYYCGADEAGIYSLIYNLGMVANVIISSAESVWIPRFTKDMVEKNYLLVNKEIKVYIYIVLGGFCSILLVAPEIILYLGGREYLAGLNMVFPIVTASFIMFAYSIYVNIEFYYKDSRMIAISTFVAAGVNLGANILFVPKFGAVAAAYTTVFAYIICFFLHSMNAKKINKFVAPYKMFIIPFFIIIAIGIMADFLLYHMIFRWSIVILLGITYYKLIKKLKKYTTKK